MTEFGTTAWGRAWLRLAQPVTITRPDPRLPRARSLAGRDRVGELEAAPGRVRAVVDDGGARRVELAFPVWAGPARAAVEAAVDGTDLPDELADRLAAAGAPVAPGPDEVRATCDCGGRSGWCRHVLATLIETARRVDESPVTALRLRGADRPAAPADRDRIRIADLDPATFWTGGVRRSRGIRPVGDGLGGP